MASNIQKTAANRKILIAKWPASDNPGKVTNSGIAKPIIPKTRPVNFDFDMKKFSTFFKILFSNLIKRETTIKAQLYKSAF